MIPSSLLLYGYNPFRFVSSGLMDDDLITPANKVQMPGWASSTYFAWATSKAPCDINGDGYDDIFIETYNYFHVVYGNPALSGATNFNVNTMTATQGFKITG
jgi:hypothetical protein